MKILSFGLRMARAWRDILCHTQREQHTEPVPAHTHAQRGLKPHAQRELSDSA